jgi:hypothetical protein
VARQDPVAGAVMLVYGIAGAVQMALNPRRTLHVLRGGGWYDDEIADAERRMAEWNAAQSRARARHVAAARDQEWPSP